MNTFESDEWVDVEEGLGQVTASYDIYAEEFLSEFKAGKEVGEFLNTLIVYKVLCDHHGNERKRFLTAYASCSGVHTVSKAKKDLIDSIKKEKRHVYKRFRDYRHKKPISHHYTTWLDVPEEEVDAIADRITDFKQTRSDPFTYPELMSHVICEFPSLDVEKMHRGYSRWQNNLGLVLFNNDLHRKDKRALFTGVNAFVK